MSNTMHVDADVDKLEKGSGGSSPAAEARPDSLSGTTSHDATTSKTTRVLAWTTQAMRRLQIEERGIHRVMPKDRHDTKRLGYAQVAMLWFSINLAANNITLGMLGPSVYSLPFLDAALCAVLGMLLGCLPVCYMATFGPASGCRTMVLARYHMGWWPAKLVVVLNIVVFLGYCLIDAVVAGQILSAVSPNGSLSVVVGIIIVCLIVLALTTFGYKAFHYYERYAWIPQLVVLSILAGVAGPHFDLSTATALDAETLAGNRLSFFSLCLAAGITYAGGAADYFVYYPATTPRWKVFTATLAGLSCSFSFAFILGIGLATGAASTTSPVPEWSAAAATSQGALLVAGYAPLGAFGSACAVFAALGLVANMVPPAYSAGVDVQVLGRLAARVPRPAWNALGVVAFAACALAGRDHLAAIFTNFLALMGYWVVCWIAVAVEEDFIFRRRGRGMLAWDWDAWDRRARLPVGFAALVAFLVGWAGAIVCMDQVYYVGPIARLVGQDGADMGNYVSFAWAALVYPPLRWLEIRRFER